jgi:hypothetical protein
MNDEDNYDNDQLHNLQLAYLTQIAYFNQLIDQKTIELKEYGIRLAERTFENDDLKRENEKLKIQINEQNILISELKSEINNIKKK